MISEHKVPQFFNLDDEIKILIELIYKNYGYDFSDYSEASFKRRVIKVLNKFNLPSFTELKYKIISDEVFFNEFLEEITVNVTEMFRDSSFYRLLKSDVIPQLATYPIIRIWHAGCSTGEEVYSFAILLKEAGILEKCLIYSTDISLEVLHNAKEGKIALNKIEEYNRNYLASGGERQLNDYYSIKNGYAYFNEELKLKMIFSPHNLVTDQSFNEFNIIFCRNVMIYFNRNLQNRVIKLFYDSLSNFGFLALGTKENIGTEFKPVLFDTFNKKEKIWRKAK